MREIVYANYHWFDPTGEEMFELRHPPKKLSVTGKSLRTCALAGIENPRTKQIVFLHVCRLPIGGRLGTTVEEYNRFIRAMNSEEEAA